MVSLFQLEHIAPSISQSQIPHVFKMLQTCLPNSGSFCSRLQTQQGPNQLFNFNVVITYLIEWKYMSYDLMGSSSFLSDIADILPDDIPSSTVKSCCHRKRLRFFEFWLNLLCLHSDIASYQFGVFQKQLFNESFCINPATFQWRLSQVALSNKKILSCF